MLVRCLYASHAVEPLAQHALDQILDKSRRNNPARGITGLLCVSNGIFVQVLEGARESVSALLVDIMKDDRHRGMQILMFEEITERHFGNWSMGKVNIDALNSAVLLKYSDRMELNPFSGPARSTMALLMELTASGSIAHRAG